MNLKLLAKALSSLAEAIDALEADERGEVQHPGGPLDPQAAPHMAAPGVQPAQPAQGAVQPVQPVVQQPAQQPVQQPVHTAQQPAQTAPLQGSAADPQLDAGAMMTYLGTLSQRLNSAQQVELGNLVMRYGPRISEIDPARYPEIMKEVKEKFDAG